MSPSASLDRRQFLKSGARYALLTGLGCLAVASEAKLRRLRRVRRLRETQGAGLPAGATVGQPATKATCGPEALNRCWA